MTLPKNYQPAEVEPQLENFWARIRNITILIHKQKGRSIRSIPHLPLYPGTCTWATYILQPRRFHRPLRAYDRETGLLPYGFRR